jgi:hypothetical protein
MNDASLDLLLVVLFGCLALSVISVVVLRASTSRQMQSDTNVFARGSVPPYTTMVSLRAKYFLPWMYPAQLLGAGLVSRVSFWLARLGAYGAMAALVGLVVAMVLGRS